MDENCDEDSELDPMVGLKQLEKLISEAQEFDSNHTNLSFNENKLLNQLLDKPIDGNQSDKEDNDEEEVEAEEDNSDDEEEEEESLEIRGNKRSIDDEMEEEMSEEHNDNNSKKLKSNSKNKNKKKKGSNGKSQTMRKNIKTIFTETELDKETLAARKEEEERMARQRERSHQRLQEIQTQNQIQSQLNSAFNSIATHSNSNNNFNKESYSEIPDEVLVLSSDEEDNDNSSLNNLLNDLKPAKESTEIIDLSSGDEESIGTNYRPQNCSGIRLDYNMMGAYDVDDVAIIDGDNGLTQDSQDNYEDLNNCGSHTDDLLNTPDSEGRVLVNVAHPSNEPDIYLAPQIARSVKPHQIGGIRFLYDNVIESVERYENSVGFGCILSHSMGLGKTLQVIAFIDVFLSQTKAKYVLCIVPINTLQNWIAEFNMWLPEEGNLDKYLKKDKNTSELKYRNFKLFALNEAKSITARAKEILLWRKSGGVLLLGYEMYRILTSNNKKKSTKDDDIKAEVLEEINKELQASLLDPGPDLVVCDEGHRIKNCNAATSLALKNIRTKRRIVLTGYPLQNNLIEYWCMVDFVRPNYLGMKAEFTNMFERPITNGQCIDSTRDDRKLMRYRAHVLYKLLKGFVQRRSHSVLKRALPNKCEYVLLCRMSDIQKQLMLAFLDTAINDPNSIGTASGRISTLLLFSVCCKIWNHPDIVYDIIREGISSDDLDIDIPAKNKKSPKNNKKKGNELTSKIESLALQSSMNQLLEPTNNLFSTPLRTKNEGVIDYSWAENLLSQYKPGVIENSHKMVVLFEIIEETMACGDRLLIFSQSLFTLDLIERFLKSREVPKTKSKWAKNQTYYRLDGSTPTHEREKYINQFNNKRIAHLFLISTRAGSLGINLIGANRIVIFDASWNPCHDAQAACRIYRYGQSKPCFIYRLICDNSLEKKIYDRQVNKQGMANRVVDEQNVIANFTWREIHALLDDLHEINEPPVQDYSDELSKYSDHLIKHLITKLNYCITRSPFEHESLLLDSTERKLTDSEKKMAEMQYSIAKKAKELDYNSVHNSNYNAIRSQIASRFQSNHLGSGYYNSGPTSMLPTQITPTPNCFYDMPLYPDISQPLPPYPPQPRAQTTQDFTNFESLAESLVRNGNTVKKMLMPKDLFINVSQNNTINVKRGEEVMVIQTAKGTYLRTKDGDIISIKGLEELAKSCSNGSMRGSPLSSYIPVSNNDSFGIVQPNLHCGGTVHLASHSRATSTVSHPPEVVDLTDDESLDDLRDNTMNLFNTQTISTSSTPSILTNGSIRTDSSSQYIPIDNETLPIDSSQTLDSYPSSNIIDDLIESMETYSHSNNSSFQSEPTFTTSTPRSRPESLALDSSPSAAASYARFSPSTPSSQVTGSSINLEA